MADDPSLYLCLGEVSCFDNEDGDGGSDGGDAGDGDGGGGDGDGGKTFSTEDVNRIVEERLARDRKKNEEKYLDLESRYSALLDDQNLSTEERSKLEGSLEDVRKQLRTKEEDAKHELKQVQSHFEKQLAEEKVARESWEKRFHESSVSRALQDAAVLHDAYNSSQIVSLLTPMTKHRPKIDEATGKETDVFETVIDFQDRDENGSEVITQRTPEETVKRMKELSDYANLFKSNVVSGVGANSATGGLAPGENGRIDVRKLTAEQYMKIRKDNPELLGM